jgi:colicin import membrane protein
MKAQSALRSIAAALPASLLAALLAACGSAPQVAHEAAPAPTQSVEQADQRLAAVAQARAAIEARFAERERACYEKFFVNYCLDAAKDRHRSALAAQRAIEVEAERFKRKAKVDERDRAMAEAEKAYQAEEARAGAEPAPAPRDVAGTPQHRPVPVAERVARHKAKIQAAEARDQAEASKRAANVAAFNKRKAESEARQREVARRKAEKAAKAAKEQPAAPAATPPAE